MQFRKICQVALLVAFCSCLYVNWKAKEEEIGKLREQINCHQKSWNEFQKALRNQLKILSEDVPNKELPSLLRQLYEQLSNSFDKQASCQLPDHDPLVQSIMPAVSNIGPLICEHQQENITFLQVCWHIFDEIFVFLAGTV